MPSDDDAASVPARLAQLGDPSGHQDAAYWDDWFAIVSPEQETFEWYCGAAEIVRVLESLIDEDLAEARMLHPGGGTSKLPIELLRAFPESTQIVADVSQKALDGFRQVLSKLQAIEEEFQSQDAIQCVQADFLNAALPFDDGSLDVWIDKGFVDAVFSSSPEGLLQSERLFAEAVRVLNDTRGMMLTVSLAEEHSLNLLVHNWLQCQPHFTSSFHVFELEPLSGNFRPFGIVFFRSEPGSEASATNEIVWHSSDGPTETYDCEADSLKHRLFELIDQSRKSYLASKQTDQSQRRILITIDVKPTGMEVDLTALAGLIQQESFTSSQGIAFQPIWHPLPESESSYRIAPLAFGLSKLQLYCLLDTELVEDLCEAIVDRYPDDVLSVDPDWTSSIPVAPSSR